MYICICNTVSDRQIQNAVRDGARSVDDLHRLLSLGSQCGNCKDCAKQCLNDALAMQDAATLTLCPA